jgi:hypothetical protein
MGRASDAFRELNEQPPRGEEERLHGALPALRLKVELTADVAEPGSIATAMEALAHGQARNVMIHDSVNDLSAVLVPLERYVELVGKELQGSQLRDATPDGRLIPADLADAEVEMSDPAADWSPSQGDRT